MGPFPVAEVLESLTATIGSSSGSVRTYNSSDQGSNPDHNNYLCYFRLTGRVEMVIIVVIDREKNQHKQKRLGFSVTRSGDLSDFGQLLNAVGNT